MSLRTKALLIFSFTLILLFGIVLALVKGSINRQFDRLENENMLRHIQQLSVKFVGGYPVTPGQPTVRIYGHDAISATIPLMDSSGKVVETEEFIEPSLLHEQAQETVRIFFIALASSAGIILFVAWYLLDENVIFPMRRMSDKLAKATAEGDLPSGLSPESGLELGELAQRIEDLTRTVAFAEENYRAIVEDQTDLIFRYLPDGSITFVNKALCSYFGRSRESFLSTNGSAFVAGEDAHRVAEIIKNLSPENPVATFDHRVTAPDGSVAWFRRTERATFLEDGKLWELQSVARDVTQAHLSRQKIEASETRYRRLFETATDGILIIKQSNGTIAAVNPKLCGLLDLPRSAIIGRQLEMLPSFKNSKTADLLKKLLDDNQPVRETEIAIVSENGDRRYSEVTASFYDEEGEHVVQLNFRDITLRRQANDELRQLSGHLMLLQDAERRRIARELHDSTAQNLSAVQMSLTQIENAIPGTETKALAALQETRTLTDLSLNEIRTISYLLHPPLLDEVGLIFALRWYVDGFMTRTEKIVRLEIPDSLQRLSAEIETTIFRIVQEGLTNVHRHSGARRAWIRLGVEGDRLVLEIRDDGHGMAPASALPGLGGVSVLGVGIAGMRERLRQFNGSLLLESDRNGTIIRASLPLEINEPAKD